MEPESRMQLHRIPRMALRPGARSLVTHSHKATAQLWEGRWTAKFGRVPGDPNDAGYGFTPEQLEAFKVPPAPVLLDYARASWTATTDYLQHQDDDTLLNMMVPNPYGGQITLAMVFQQLLWELNQHGGQIAYLRGMQRGLEDPLYTGGVLS